MPDKRLEKLADVVAGLGDSSLIAAGSTSEESRLRKLSGSTELTVEVLPPSEEELSLSKSARRRPPIVPATVQFVDIAGLVKGASEGAGLGNKFLAHIREVSVICHVVRVFDDENVIKEGAVDPKTDYETIETELILADLETLEKSKIKNQKSKVVEKLVENLDKGIPARDIKFSDEEKEIIDQLFLLSAKPELIILNVAEQDYDPKTIDLIIKKYTSILVVPEEQLVVISAKIEAELSELNEEEQKQYLKELGVEESGLERLIKKAYETLGLISFLTAGEKEVRAWTIKKGTNAQMASGVIHTDFIKNFIKVEVISCDDFVSIGGWKKARELGKTRMEGRDYIMAEGDVVEFKIGR
ncbi:MAG: redox-regulated ATPase YchF [Candidatus Levybacteria bacterium RIFCSPHIGHO2_01_FULL_36_15]|nr:MAG: redox-regulated ATPase YchF [Candidatus Levybacteria bacterium RIFCSPHIGHO2_01_FULL_36_15]